MPQLALGFYSHRENVSEVLKNLRSCGFRRSALVTKSSSGKLDIAESSLWKVSLGLTGLVLGSSLYLLSEPSGLARALLVLAGLLMLGGVLYRERSRLSKQVLDQCSRLVLENEALVIVQIPDVEANRVLEVLRGGNDVPPATFVIRAERDSIQDLLQDKLTREPLASEALRDHATGLARLHPAYPPVNQGHRLLERLKESSQDLVKVRNDLSRAVELEQPITPAAEWLLDNAYIIQGHIVDIRRNLPRNYAEELPTLKEGFRPSELRVEFLARHLVETTDARLSPSNITEFLQAYQTVSPLTIGELWVFPVLLRFVLVEDLRNRALQVNRRQHEREWADVWANRLLAAARREPDQLLGILAELTREQARLRPHFAVRLAGHLHDEEAALSPVRNWLEVKLGCPLQEAIRQEQARQAGYQISIANAIGSLRQLAQMDWRDVFESVSCVEAVLREDPAGVHSQSDFETRDRCRRSLERMAREAKVAELEVARSAILLAQRESCQGDDRRCHVGYYLIAGGRTVLESQLNCKRPLTSQIQRYAENHPSLVYLGSIVLLSSFILTLTLFNVHNLGRAPWGFMLLAALALFPASELALQTINILVSWLMQPRVLPKLSFKNGIPEEHRSLVVVPMMLLTPESVRGEVEKLEVRYLGNRDPQLRYALVSDFTDAPQENMPEDPELLEVVVQGIERLNAKYAERPFFLFHRSRHACRTQRCWMGWERKRGKVEELTAYLCGEGNAQLLRVGERSHLGSIRFIITLDADTQLPHDTAKRLIETLAHPLNRPRLGPDRRSLVEGYTIIQPRVSITLPSATITPFTRLFSDPTGTDPYAKAVSDVYQDLFAEGIFHGKAIFDVEAFYRVLGRRFPEETLLSHDLIEGAHVRVGYASDVELFEQFPVNYQSYMKRQHRWVRGDWQIARWVLPTVPGPDGSPQPNPLSFINRWKILDNLRRSLVAAASVALLVTGWLLFPASASPSLLVGLMLLCSPLGSLPGRVLQCLRKNRGVWKEQGRELLRVLVSTALLPHQAFLSLDAIARVGYRRVISRRNLLEWESAQVAHWNAANRLSRFVFHMVFVTIGAVILTIVLCERQFHSWFTALPFLTLWLISPLVADWMNGHKRQYLRPRLSHEERQFLRHIACQTWRYFDDLVGPQTHWLPPDNSQESLRIEVAQRTSPTNIGLWLLSALAARDLGYITRDEMVDRTLASLETMATLERYEGHFLNWYDIQTLAPLRPPYVSTVDSGNLVASLWILEQGCRDGLAEPVLGTASLQGLADRLELLQALLDREDLKNSVIRNTMMALGQLFQNPVDDLEQIVRCLRRAQEPVQRLAQVLRSRLAAEDERVYWVNRIEENVTAWGLIIDRYLGWFEVVIDLPQDLLKAPDDAVLREWKEHWKQAPSLQLLASPENTVLSRLLKAGSRDPSLASVLDRVLQAFSHSRRQAVEAIEQTDNVLQRARRFGDETNMRFLYDPRRRLFTIGYNVGTRSRDTSYYDLLASEARLASLIAIARGEVPVEHWLALGRPYGASDGKPVLLSWSGTMFEYLMPLLFTRTFENSLLDSSCQAAVSRQIQYARQRGVPWGISESAFSALDVNRIYQYRAFGVPGLGLKRGLEEDLVVAPYATCLALTIDPIAAINNLRRLSKLGLRGAKGYYEAIDYTRQQRPEGSRGVVIYAYMAHHQGMSLLAIDNILQREIMQRRFHADLRIRATEFLFFERIPATSLEYFSSSPEPPIARLITATPATAETRRTRENTRIPRSHLLSNGTYTVMTTNAGGGYSRWRDFDITRWRADTTRDAWGTFCYIRDLNSGDVWSTTYHPVDRPERRYSASFAADRIEFRRRDFGIETLMEVVVSPEDDAEVRRITLTNTSSETRRLELTTYLELALAAHNADRTHPAFSKLFIQTEALPEQNALLAGRRLRSPEDPSIWAAHLMAATGSFGDGLEYETNRATFIGRGRGLQNPAAMEGPLSNQSGAVLDPIFSLRRKVELRPSQKIRLALVTLAAETRERILALVKKYQDLPAANRALEFAWTHAQLELRYLGLQADEAQVFQDLGAQLLYPNNQLRPPPERLRRNLLGQSRLWAYGISGDLPILAMLVSESQELGVVREALLAHTYWRVRGLKADLVILNKEATSYDQPLQSQLTRLVQAYSVHTGIDRPGGVFLRSVEQMPEEDLTLLLASARALLVAARGSLERQLGRAAEAVEMPPLLEGDSKTKPEPSTSLPVPNLRFFNGTGGFTPDGSEYVIQLEPGAQTPSPWVNIMANPHFGALVSESGPGFLWCGNSQTNRQIPWLNDPVSLVVAEGIYLRDEESGIVWSPTPLPVRDTDTAYRARHGQGYSRFEHNSHGVEQQLTTFVPVDGKPLRVQCLRLRNASARRRRLSVTSYAEWTLGIDREETQPHIVTSWDSASHTLLARNNYHPEFSKKVAFAALSPPAESFTSDRTEFLGRNGSSLRPAALERQHLAGRTGAGLDPCAALQVQIQLVPGETAEVLCLLGQADELGEVRSLVEQFRNPRVAQQSLADTKNWWDELLGGIQVQTPDLAVDFLLNRWLIYQTLSCRIWARSAFYQSGGAFGFRDQLQDVMALVYAAPDLAREHILRASSRQFVEGDVQHWWHPPSGAGIRSRCSDDLLWLPYATAHYVRTTGDTSILEVRIPFLEGRPLEQHEHEAYFVPTPAMEDGSLFEHCWRAIRKGSTQGPHGLPLIGSCDWNDGMNRVGTEGKGESVWLAWFLLDVLKGFIPICELVGQVPPLDFCQQRIEELAEAVEAHGWDGEWYRRAYFDDGTPLGSKDSQEAIIDSLPQSWAVISGMGNEQRARQAMSSVEKLLIRRSEKLIQLYTPPFDHSQPHPGYIMGYPPGVRENGGQYTHAAIWVAMAFARSGDGRRAVELLRMLNPIEHARTAADVARYKGEPYVVAADIFTLEGQVGRSGWTWYTGSSGWMYRVWLEEVLGFKLRGDTLLVDPTIPPEWTEYSLRYRYNRTSYEMLVENPDHVNCGVLWVELDGARLATPWVPLCDDGLSHRIRVRMGKDDASLKERTVEEELAEF